MASERQVAVALRYLTEREDAPRVVAKGRGTIAERIVDLARRRGIPVHQDTDLVEVLARIDIEAIIPPELYKAVAEILAHLYRINREKS